MTNIRGKISEMANKLEKQAQARISRTSNLHGSWQKTVNKLDAQSPVQIDYSKYSSNEEAKKNIFENNFKTYGGGVRDVIVDTVRRTSSETIVHETKTVSTNITVNFILKTN